MATTSLFRNWILSQLPEYEYRRLAPHLQAVNFEMEHVFYEPYTPIHHAYFIDTGLVSVVSTMNDGKVIEVAIAANEGMIGVPILLGIDNIPCQYFAQVGGRALRIKTQVLQAEMGQCNMLRTLLQRYMATFITQLMQVSACNSLHSVSQRCVRWLLMYEDRLRTREHPLTHDFLARLLGVRRASVTEVLHPLQEQGSICYKRGKISVLDRQRLVAFSCECYRIIAKYYQDLLTVKCQATSSED
jgi:CRP-like cAMP-binding protein